MCLPSSSGRERESPFSPSFHPSHHHHSRRTPFVPLLAPLSPLRSLPFLLPPPINQSIIRWGRTTCTRTGGIGWVSQCVVYHDLGGGVGRGATRDEGSGGGGNDSSHATQTQCMALEGREGCCYRYWTITHAYVAN